MSDGGGDPACWADRVCPACGMLDERERRDGRCPHCGVRAGDGADATGAVPSPGRPAPGTHPGE